MKTKLLLLKCLRTILLFLFFVNGHIYAQSEINITGNSISIIDGDTTPNSTDWTYLGSTPFGGSINRTYTIQNSGTSSLTIGAITFTGTNAAEFTILTPPSAIIVAGGSSTFTIRFLPTAVGARTATINIVNNDSNENPYNFSIRGDVTEQEINIQGNSISIVDGDTTPTVVDWTGFGNISVGTSITRTYTIQNVGTLPLTIGAITFTGTNASEFVVTTAPTSPIAGGASTTFVVTFTPTALGSRTATINIINNDSNENPYNYNLQGNGLVPVHEINLTGNTVSITNGDTTPATADWTDFGSTSTRSFTIQNIGNGTLTIGTISISGPNAADFSISTLPASSIEGGFNSTFIIKFSPSVVGLRSATISIINNDGDENPYTFSIQGTGIAQEINILGNAVSIVDGDTTPATSDFTDFSTLASKRVFTIQNTGTIPLTIGAITFSGTNASDFSIVAPLPSSTIDGGISTTVTVLFSPTSTGVKTATISIVNNDTNGENPYNFSLSGTGNSPVMVVNGNTFVEIADGDTTPDLVDWTDFNITNINSNRTRTFIIENNATLNLNLTGTPLVSISGSPVFTISILPSSTISGYSSTSFTIKFSPTAIGIYNAVVSIANNDPAAGKNPYTFTITGQAVQSFFDSDGDLVFDNVDSDDDNDGIPDTVEQSNTLSSTLINNKVIVPILNETFGTGLTRTLINATIPTASTTYCFEDGTTAPESCSLYPTNAGLNDGEYIVATNAGGLSAWYQGLDHTPGDTDGKMAIFNATNDVTEEFYRTELLGVIPNAPLNYSFWVINFIKSDHPAGAESLLKPDITVEFRDANNVVLNTITTGFIPVTNAASIPNGDWYNFSSSFTPTTSDIIVVFRNNQPGGSGNDLAIDDIEITQSLNDTDGDGVADVFDLDSDNDGVGDIIEDGWVSYSNGKDTIDLTSPTWEDFNGNGWLNTSETYYLTQTAKNFDGDAVPNYLDLDSDNDALFDVDEAGLLNGDGDINGDGAGEGTDLDKDGILSLFDVHNGFANTGKPLPTNTLGTGNYDFIKTMSRTAGVYDISTSLYSSLDANNNGVIDGTADVDKDGILDAFDTNTTYYGSPRDLNRKLFLDFDGRNDYGESTGVLNGLSNASLMAWINLGSTFSNEGVIVGQDKFHIRINSSRNLEVVANSTTLTFGTTALSTNRWYHVAAVYGGGSLKLFLNGAQVAIVASAGSITGDTSLLTIGKNPIATTKFFNGKIDEVRIFNVALTDQQLQRMVYQEIQDSSAQVRGTIVPKDIESLPFANLLRYYRMDVYKDDIIDDLTTPTTDLVTGMKIYNNKNIKVQQAPMPFVTERVGDFANAVNSPTNEVRGMDIMDQDWSIVQVKHNITETSNNTDLGMYVYPSVTITMNNDTKIQNDWYLKLDGKIDLAGRSQLVQTTNSDLDPTSSGFIERDQQGQNNIYNYNYWSSPVGAINSTTNNNPYTVASVMKDGTTSTPQNITWTSGLNGSATSPITLSSYWIFKFQNQTPVYANWASVGPNGPLLPGQGFTLKGSGSGANQNYTFVGKPNNATITSTIGPNNLNLVGNPYPSAIDADSFITSNIASTTGTLYFWEHYSTNNTHNLAQYQGGYATRNLVGGTPPLAPIGVSGLGTSAKVPGRFIPVGQGFFITGSATGGTITLNNSQRIFIKENHASSNNLFRSSDIIVDKNENDIYTENNFQKIRLGFNDRNGYHRQTLLGFMNENATSGIDVGYDAILLDNQPGDMWYINSGSSLNINGEGFFNETNIYPLGVKTDATGIVSFTIDSIENFTQDIDTYIYDAVTDTYHDIRNEPFAIEIPQGTIPNRFSLRFINPNEALGTINFDDTNAIQVVFTSSNNTINIKNKITDEQVEKVELFNLLGQSIGSWDVENENQQNIQLPVKNISSATYIVKIKTTNGATSRKIIIN